MRRLTSLLIVFAVALATSTVAFAQGEGDGDGELREIDGKRVRVQYKKKEVIDFDDVLIQGELKKPQGAYLLNRKKSDFSAMIEERAHFKRELVDALDKI